MIEIFQTDLIVETKMRPPITYALVTYLVGLFTCSSDHVSFVLFSICLSIPALIYWIIQRKRKKVESDKTLYSIAFGILLVYVVLVENDDNRQQTPVIAEAMKNLPARELLLEIKIVNIKRSYVRYGRECFNYTGIIKKAPDVRKDLIGKKVLWASQNNHYLGIYKNDLITIKGLVKYQPLSILGNKRVYYKLNNIEIVEIKQKIGNFRHIRNLVASKIIGDNKKDLKGSAFMYAILLGDKTFLDAQQIELYKKTGTMHLFAVSGLHIGILYMLSCFLLQSFIKNKILMIIVSLSIVCWYVILVGSSESAVRSFIMILIWQSSTLFYKKRNSLSALLWAALIILIIDPTKINSLGFQLSFTVVISLIFSFHSITQKKKSKVFDLLKNSIIISFSSFCGSSLLMIDYFHYINPFSIIINSVMVIVIFPIFTFFLLYTIISFAINNELSVNLINFIYYILEYVIFFLNKFTFFQYHFTNVHDIPDFIHLIYPLILIFLVKYIHTLKVRLLVLAFIPSSLHLLCFYLNKFF